MADETPESSGTDAGPDEEARQPGRDTTATPAAESHPEPGNAGPTVGDGDADEPSAPVRAPAAPPAPAAPAEPEPATRRGQRRITRHTTTTRNQTTTDETVVEDIEVVAPPVWAAPTSEHPRPVG